MIEFSKERPVDTKLIRLRTGETLVSCLQEFEAGYVLEKPMLVTSVPVTDSKGVIRKVGLYLKDWIDYTDDTYFVISKDIVLVMATPDKKMVEDYTEAKVQSDMQRAESELAETMQEYLQQTGILDGQVPLDERDTGDENDYNSPQQGEDESNENDEGEDDEDDGNLPWWDGNPRVKF